MAKGKAKDKARVEIKGNGVHVVWKNEKFRFKLTVIRDAVNMAGNGTTCPMWGCKTKKEAEHPVCQECHKKYGYSLKRSIKLAREAWARENVPAHLLKAAMEAVLATEGSNLDLAQAFQMYIKEIAAEDISIESAFATVCSAKEKNRQAKVAEEKRGAFRQIKTAARQYLDTNGDEGGDIRQEAVRIAAIIAPEHGEHFAAKAITQVLENHREFQGLIDMAESYVTHVANGRCQYNAGKLASQIISEYNLKHDHRRVAAACGKFIEAHKEQRTKKVENMARTMSDRGNNQLGDELKKQLAVRAMDKAVGTARHGKKSHKKTKTANG